MKTPLTDREAEYMKDTFFFFMKENYKEATIGNVFDSLTAEHKQILKDKYPDILKGDEECQLVRSVKEATDEELEEIVKGD